MPRFNGDTSISSSIDKHWNIRKHKQSETWQCSNETEERETKQILIFSQFFECALVSTLYAKGEKSAELSTGRGGTTGGKRHPGG